MAVPQFGGWDRPKSGGATNYSMVFEQAREKRKHRKSDLRGSLGNDEELIDDNTPRRPIQPHPFINNDQLHVESPSTHEL
ncbi:hypothetical protein ACLOJK_024845 [Asimina triloba]